ncbi:hypothetical protein DP73_14555 [Desulfosporosinus sp. HMP52]|nr:hypothetical protein DP73_14555 [Desulfosporosinus sp. HMP52]
MKSRRISYRKFNSIVFLFPFVLVSIIGFSNMLIDPYGIWNLLNFSFNTQKVEKYNHQRLFKAEDIIHLKPKVVLLGSSRTFFGLNPDYYEEITGQKAYNAGFSAANTEEELAYLRHALVNQPGIQQVIIGLDFYSFNEHNSGRQDFLLDRLEKSHINWNDFTSTLFSQDAVKASLNTMKFNVNNKFTEPLIFPNGLISASGIKQFHLLGANGQEAFARELEVYINNYQFYYNYKYSAQRLQDVRTMVELCKERNIDVKVFISPSHATQWEAIQTSGLWLQFEQWKRDIAAITSVWDFSGYNSITTEPISDNMKYYWDNSHYKERTGELVFDRLMNYQSGSVPQDFGRLLTPSTVNQVIDEINVEREKWAKDNKKTTDFVKGLKQNR